MNTQESMRDRLIKILESEKMNAKTFATEVGIQAGTISNIMAGRNNPSLDVMQRVLARFRNISSDWLILGQGEMYRSQESLLADFERRQLSLFDEDDAISMQASSAAQTDPAVQTIEKEAETVSVSASAPAEVSAFTVMSSRSMSASPLQAAAASPSLSQSATTQRVVTRVVLFYSDGTFEER